MLLLAQLGQRIFILVLSYADRLQKRRLALLISGTLLCMSLLHIYIGSLSPMVLQVTVYARMFAFWDIFHHVCYN